MNSDKRFLLSKGLRHGDVVRFSVENEISGGYIGPKIGMLNLESKKYPFIKIVFNGRDQELTINMGYDAYIGSISRPSSLEEWEFEDKIVSLLLKAWELEDSE